MDLRYTCRLMRKNPGLTSICLLVIVLGVEAGGGGAALAGNSMSLLFPGLVASLPLVFLFITLVLGLLVALASYVFAKNAVALEPGDALHYQ